MIGLLRLVALLVSLITLIITTLIAVMPGDTTPPSAWIVFASLRDGSSRIYRMRADGHFEQRLSDDSATNPQWSPDGQWIVFDANSELMLMHANGCCGQNLTQNQANDSVPQWSPDGEWIVFQSSPVVGGDWEIYRMYPDGSERQNLTRDPMLDSYPQWSPDGQWIVFMSNREGNWDIYRMRPDGSDPQNLTRNQTDDLYPRWSWDGTAIIFRLSNLEYHRITLDGSELPPHSTNYDIFPWSADGQWFLYTKISSNGTEIYRMRTDGSSQQRLTYSPADDIAPAWSPPLSRSWHPWRIGAAGIMLLLMGMIPWLRILRKVPL
jgi:TolB protein